MSKTCALRAPTVFSVPMKSTSVQKTRLRLTANTAWRFYPRSPIACGCAFHPYAIGDPRGRVAVRARGATVVPATRIHIRIVDEQPLRAARANLWIKATTAWSCDCTYSEDSKLRNDHCSEIKQRRGFSRNYCLVNC